MRELDTTERTASLSIFIPFCLIDTSAGTYKAKLTLYATDSTRKAVSKKLKAVDLTFTRPPIVKATITIKQLHFFRDRFRPTPHIQWGIKAGNIAEKEPPKWKSKEFYKTPIALYTSAIKEGHTLIARKANITFVEGDDLYLWVLDKMKRKNSSSLTSKMECMSRRESTT